MIKRIAVVDRDLCKFKKCGYQCSKVCPKNRAGEECIVTEKSGFPTINESICIGCSLCVKACDKAGFKALTVVNLPQPLKEDPIHRFGPSAFCLFRLPFPKTGEVVGLVGPNGVGKTTALRILSGELKPNLGEFDKETDFSQLIRTFRGTELQSYLERLRDQDVVTSYKPQRVDQIPKVYKGKVSNVLKKTDEREILDDLLERFGLEQIINSKISEISGGELQRITIAACLAKDADFYYIDEPTSFLDVFQRLSIAKTIREYCQGRACLVVDHDLATLDFFADKIHIFYGYPGAYGIVSKPYGVRVGINTFLDGYIKEDNVKIRSEPITFFTSFAEKEAHIKKLVSFKDIKKKFKRFSLDVKQGDIRVKEVLAALGANALGKTTFARILAGETKAKGKVDSKIKISYKPQYIETRFKGTVRELLSSVADVDSDTYYSEIVRPLGLIRLLDRNVEDLSGGELQRTAIAHCLSQKADLYLLDEPSAFLDVEQRLAIAKLVRGIVEVKEKSSLIIDHDLLFLSKIGDRAMVFLGIPGMEGHVDDVTSIKNAFNTFLATVGITFRADKTTGRPRANKFDSKLDREQKEKGTYFYV